MRQYQKILAANDIYSYRRYLQQIFAILGVLLFSLVSNFAVANPFATPDDFNAASCPTGHKKYSIRNDANSATTPSLSSWTAGETSQTFTFEENSGNKTLTIKFPILIDANNSDGTVPFYGSNNGVSSNAINLVHNSTRVQTDHTLDVIINRPVSKIGYKIQDLDSTSTTRVVTYFPYRTETITPYIEQVDVSKDNGRLTFNNIFHNINARRNIVTAKDGENCRTGQCTIDATWSYKPAGSTVNLNHNNTKRETSGIHAVGYSDFYFCLAPPKIIVNKLLNGSRVDSDDQFRIELRQTSDDAFVEAFTTTGSGSVVTDNTTTVKTLSEGFSYTVSEQTINGNLLDYQTSYTCSNAATDTDIILSSGTMPVNAAGTRRTFAINNVDYGDEITCNITNTPVNNYTFTGFVFNDNGGIAKSTVVPKTESDVSATFMNNSKYFNGKFDSGELGIYDINLKVRLTDCGPNDGTDITGTTPQTVSNIATTLGQYQFTVPANAIANKPRVCLVQVEPNSWDYSIDTTPNIREVTLKNDVFDYKTEGLVNLDFGEVEADYAAIVLRKAQYVNDCPSALVYSAPTLNTAGNTNPRTGFSESGIGQNSLIPGQCIAYRITATNRANLPVSNFVMRDILQKKGDKGALVTSVLTGPIDNDSNYALTSSVPIGENGTVVTTESVINSKASRRFYFNTKYGTTVDP